MNIKSEVTYVFDANDEETEFWEMVKWARDRNLEIKVGKCEGNYGIRFTNKYYNEPAQNAIKWLTA